MTIERLALFEMLYKAERCCERFGNMEKRPDNDWGQKFFYAEAASRWGFVAGLVRGVINNLNLTDEFEKWKVDKDSLGSDII